MVETLGEAYDEGWSIVVRCAWGKRDGLKSIRECQHQVAVDMPTLVWTRGRACPIDRLSDLMRCSRCGSRRVRILYFPPSQRSSGRSTA